MRMKVKRICLCLLGLLLLQSCAFAQESKLIVSGSSTVYMQADRAWATLGVSLTGTDVGQLQQQANERVNAICDALQAEGLDADCIATEYFYISPVYDYSGPVESISGYTVSSSLTILTEDMERLGAYIDAAIAAGANTFGSISFGVKDDTEARSRALELAVQDAHGKAETIAGASGMQLGGVLEIREGGVADYGMNTGRSYAMDSAGGAKVETIVRAAQVGVTANVEICYELK